MNKTVNINLANILFHIDEEAYNKMRRYLESIKRSFANTPGSDEILSDIEARIAELFHEKLENERQVISNKEVDEVIAIMGQPEDYMVDEDIFEDEPKSSSSEQKRVKKLYRDIQTKYVAGVSSGLAHYVGLDPLWIRLLWVILAIGSGGGFILLYGLLWILIPEAATTSQQLDMRGEDINISNIERKVKEGFDDIADKVKSVDYEKVGDKVKNGGKTFFDTLGDIVMFFFKIFGKFIGILLIIVGAATIIGMFIGMLTIGTLDWVNIPGVDNFISNPTEAPVWVLSLMMFFAIGIPFFFLFYLGLKILINNLKSIGSIAKFSLLGLWLISLIGLTIIGVKTAAAHAYSGSTTIEEEVYFENPIDTLNITAVTTKLFDNRGHIRVDDSIITYDDDGEEVLLSDNVRFKIKKTKDSIISIEIRKEANGKSFNAAREKSNRINYGYKAEGNTIYLDDYLTAESKNRFSDQEVRVTLYVPVGTVLKYNKSSRRCPMLRANNDRDMNGCDMSDYIWEMSVEGELECLDCTVLEKSNEDQKGHIIINEEGIDINIKDEDGENFEMKINEDGVKIRANDNQDSRDTNVIIIDDEGVDIDLQDDSDSLSMKIGEDGVLLKTKGN
ncbi:Glutamate synthase [NADPH] large chain [hydrothermal vent metagenome]|uniref:Glutamate synthase [NADPH] large chain n=1 Tax=hydrothermal vent metagenome TaxID=652676 RepID=A0A3B0TB03_9ZZZZ